MFEERTDTSSSSTLLVVKTFVDGVLSFRVGLRPTSARILRGFTTHSAFNPLSYVVVQVSGETRPNHDRQRSATENEGEPGRIPDLECHV